MGYKIADVGTLILFILTVVVLVGCIVLSIIFLNPLFLFVASGFMFFIALPIGLFFRILGGW